MTKSLKNKARQLSQQRENIHLMLDGKYARNLQRLPWHKPLLAWKKSEAKFLLVKSGLSRHIIRFVQVQRNTFAIKETSVEAAEREFNAYLHLKKLGVPTLIPVGTVKRNEGSMPVETNIGTQVEARSTGYIITQLLEYSIPNYFLFRRQFQKVNRKRIWDAIIQLFVRIHCKGVFWGDASLSNMMIVFAKQQFPEIGIRTTLRAVLADAETVEFHQQISEPLRMADIENFLESMAWTEEDMRTGGILPDPMMTADDQRYILERYRDLYETEREEQTFELITNIDVDELLGTFQARGQSKALLQHIYEHKWYLSEQKKTEITIEEAARDWYKTVFRPVVKFFADYNILDDFPDSTAASLYLDIMLHKYYLSEQLGKDVGLTAAFESYARKFHGKKQSMEKMTGFVRSMRKLLEK
jgi:hypothetical protein